MKYYIRLIILIKVKDYKLINKFIIHKNNLYNLKDNQKLILLIIYSKILKKKRIEIKIRMKIIWIQLLFMIRRINQIILKLYKLNKIIINLLIKDRFKYRK